jgi:hypothetical protein
MNRELSRGIIDTAVGMGKALGELDLAVGAIPDMDERKKFSTSLADVIGQINDSFIRPLVKQYPDLEPDAD